MIWSAPFPMLGTTLLAAPWLLHGAFAASKPSHTSPRCDVAAFTPPTVPGAEVVSIAVEERRNKTFVIPFEGVPPLVDLYYCEVNVYLTHIGANDKVLVQTWLPLTHDEWNGRFQATGGGGFATGMFEMYLGEALQSGYVGSSTDGGFESPDLDSISWALDSDGSIKWDLMLNFGTRSLADMIYVGKDVTEQFYGEKAHHSYWNGASQGGRQGYTIAQEYPDLLDGILAAMPALGLDAVPLALLYPQIVMKEENALMSDCELDWFAKKAVEECDILDGMTDGIIEDPEACAFTPEAYIGHRISCDGQEDVVVTEDMGTAIRRIHEGPQTPSGASIWPGFSYGTPLSGVANTSIAQDGTRTLQPNTLAVSFIQNVLLRDLAFNVSTLSYSELTALWAHSSEQYGWLFRGLDPNLRAFRDAGGKLLSWHGTVDELLPYQTTTGYRDRVNKVLGCEGDVNEFYRLFLAPGVGHGGGDGLMPTDALAQLVDWVEKGKPPAVLHARKMQLFEGKEIARDLCPYPSTSRYTGVASPELASSWTCERLKRNELDGRISTRHDLGSMDAGI